MFVDKSKIDTMHDDILVIKTLLSDKDNGICPKIKKLDSTVYGNGRLGLKTQVAIMWIFGGFITALVTPAIIQTLTSLIKKAVN
jgi:hypothetical protein